MACILVGEWDSAACSPRPFALLAPFLSSQHPHFYNTPVFHVLHPLASGDVHSLHWKAVALYNTTWSLVLKKSTRTSGAWLVISCYV